MAQKKERQKKEKPLEDWTIKELREEALKVPNVQGIHGMNKQEIIDFLRQEKGLPAVESKRIRGSSSFQEKSNRFEIETGSGEN